MGGYAVILVCLIVAACLYLVHVIDNWRAAKPAPWNTWRYCPWCRGRLVVGLIEGKKKLRCSRCEFVHWNNPKPKAKLLIPTADGGIVLIAGPSGYLELPGGYIDEYETLHAGGRREALEETGLKVEIERELAVHMRDKSNEHEHFFLTKVVAEKPVPGDDALEAIVAPVTAVPFERMRNKAHMQVIRNWLAEQKIT